MIIFFYVRFFPLNCLKMQFNLTTKQSLLADGAIGTLLLQKKYLASFEDLNRSHPEIIKEIHENYVQSGCQVLFTNTFGLSSSQKFAPSEFFQIQKTGVEIIQSISDEILIFGSIGPALENSIGKWTIDVKSTWHLFERQIEGFLQLPVNAIVFETFTRFEDVEMILQILDKLKPQKPVWFSVSPQKDGTIFENDGCRGDIRLRRTPTMVHWQQWTNLLNQSKYISGIGLNCAEGPESVQNYYFDWIEVVQKPIMLKLNKGLPKQENGIYIYPLSDEDYADRLVKLRHDKIKIWGGCCGATPQTIQRMKEKLFITDQ